MDIYLFVDLALKGGGKLNSWVLVFWGYVL